MNQISELHDSWPAEGLESLGHCPVCRSSRSEIAHDDCRDVVFGAAEGTWSMHRCMECGSGFLDPRPTADTIGRAYSVYYTHQSRLRRQPPRRSLKHKLLDRIRGSYINAHYGRGRASLGGLGRLLARRLPRMMHRLDLKYRFIPFPGDVAQPRLLDLGCGNGDFLKVAGAVGWQVYGSDPDPAALKVVDTLRCEVRQGGIDVWQDSDGTFDAITMNHVIEHLHDPVRDLKRCHALLKPGGHIGLETPNFDAVGRSVYGSNWRGLEIPRHLVIFTWDSLRTVLKDCGFEIAREMPRDNFLKQARRSAKAEAGIFDHQHAADTPLRMPDAQSIQRSRDTPDRSEWISLLARKPAR